MIFLTIKRENKQKDQWSWLLISNIKVCSFTDFVFPRQISQRMIFKWETKLWYCLIHGKKPLVGLEGNIPNITGPTLNWRYLSIYPILFSLKLDANLMNNRIYNSNNIFRDLEYNSHDGPLTLLWHLEMPHHLPHLVDNLTLLLAMSLIPKHQEKEVHLLLQSWGKFLSFSFHFPFCLLYLICFNFQRGQFHQNFLLLVS